jgi:hypothetical protein
MKLVAMLKEIITRYCIKLRPYEMSRKPIWMDGWTDDSENKSHESRPLAELYR